MRIDLSVFVLPKQAYSCDNKRNYSNYRLLTQDTVSFSAKKSEFGGFDLYVVNKFKAPIEKFKTNNDLQNWCKDELKKYEEKDYTALHEKSTKDRKRGLEEWFNYLQSKDNDYTPATKLLILDGITKNLFNYNDNEPMKFNKSVLKDTLEEMKEKLENKRNCNIDFNKLYKMNLNKVERGVLVDDNGEEVKGETGWVIIPGKDSDIKNFEINVEKLKTLSADTWCTKSYNAEKYLSRGDFHIYVENGKSKIGVRFKSNTIVEIQGERNNSRIPLPYLDKIKSHIQGTKLSTEVVDEIKYAERAKIKIEELQKKIGKPYKSLTCAELFSIFGMLEKIDDDGLIILKEYKQPDKDFTWDDIGFSENRLFKKIKGIRGDADFYNSRVTNLGILETIGGNAKLQYTRITNLGNLRKIGGDVDFLGSKVTDLGELCSIGGNVNLGGSHLINLGKLYSIEGNVDFRGSMVTDLGNLHKIGGDVIFLDSMITNLGKLHSIEGDADFLGSVVMNLGNLNKIGGNADFFGAAITDLNKLKTIGGNFRGSNITNLGELEVIGGNADFGFSNITNLGQLKAIRGDADFGYSKITNLSQLETIGGNASFRHSEVINLGNLRTIGGKVDFMYSKLKESDFKNIDLQSEIYLTTSLTTLFINGIINEIKEGVNIIKTAVLKAYQRF